MSSAATPRSWEVIVRWGTHRITTELLDDHRPTLSLGDSPTDDVATGSPASVTLERVGENVSVVFGQGVTGALARKGDWPLSIGEVVDKGLAREHEGRYRLELEPTDELQLNVGTLAVEVRRSGLTPKRPPFDVRWLLPLALALFILGSLFASFVAPNDGPRMKWFKRHPVEPVRLFQPVDAGS